MQEWQSAGLAGAVRVHRCLWSRGHSDFLGVPRLHCKRKENLEEVHNVCSESMRSAAASSRKGESCAVQYIKVQAGGTLSCAWPTLYFLLLKETSVGRDLATQNAVDRFSLAMLSQSSASLQSDKGVG